MLDYKLIEALAMVVQEGGFDKAAQVLHLTQSAVSQRVKQLEDQIGRVLLARSSPPVPTKAGQLLLKHHRQVSRLEGDLRDVLTPESGEEATSLPVGVNADSLATWFFDAVRPVVERRNIVLDLSVDDQDETHKLLRNGDVIGCVSAESGAMQGCRAVYLGTMVYRMLAAPAFISKWFPDGLTLEAVSAAPTLIFNRKDDLHNKVFRKIFNQTPPGLPAFYVPSSEGFPTVLENGWAYGMLPDQQSRQAMAGGRLVELTSEARIRVELYWHCWNVKSKLIDEFTDALVKGAAGLLER